MLRRCLFAALLLPCFAVAALADVTPHSLFTDHMVLQQGMKVPVWGKASPGEKVVVKLGEQEASCEAGADGRWKAELPPLAAGGPFELTIKGNNEIKLADVLVGEVWICSGQSNMEWPVIASKDPKTTLANCANDKIRFFKAPRAARFEPQRETQAKWTACDEDNARTFSAVGYFFGRDLQKARNVPVGLIQAAWGGTPAESWTSAEFLAKTPELKPMIDRQAAAVAAFQKDGPRLLAEYEANMKEWRAKNLPEKPAEGKGGASVMTLPKPPPFKAPEDPSRSAWGPSQLYAGMIHPLVPFAVRGAIWYQGESNAGRAYEYRTLMPTLIQSWRAAFGQDFPFLMVQLAPFEKGVAKDIWPELREAQLLTAQRTPLVGMAVITDAGDLNDIHPKDKETVGARLALIARGLAYQESPLVWSGPVYESASFENGKAILRFTHVGSGLKAKGGELKGFTICGRDKNFIPAKARIEGQTVVVEHADVPEPVAVRFGWTNAADVDLWNQDGLPATPFRTDDFPMLTKPKGK